MIKHLRRFRHFGHFGQTILFLLEFLIHIFYLYNSQQLEIHTVETSRNLIIIIIYSTSSKFWGAAPSSRFLLSLKKWKICQRRGEGAVLSWCHDMWLMNCKQAQLVPCFTSTQQYLYPVSWAGVKTVTSHLLASTISLLCRASSSFTLISAFSRTFIILYDDSR